MRQSIGKAGVRPRSRALGTLSATLLVQADLAKLAAAEYCLLTFPTLYTAGVPSKDPGSENDLWKVPIVVVHPDRGVVGEVGEVIVDAKARCVVRGTEYERIIAAGEKLWKAEHNARAVGNPGPEII